MSGLEQLVSVRASNGFGTEEVFRPYEPDSVSGTLSAQETVPEPGTTASLFALGILGTGAILKRKKQTNV